MDLQMGLAETMKNIAKGIQTEINNAPFNGVGYVTEKLYMLLQLYIQNKGWNPSVELLQCFTELKEASMLPSASYLQMLASRVTLDSQGRLILRENGKIILPYEHFANAVMLKHMNGPHGLHLNVDATVRAVMDSYTIGRDEFGMEKEFIVEVVQNCPNPTCRYYKTQLPGSSSTSHNHSTSNKANSFMTESLSNKASTNSNSNANATSTNNTANTSNTIANNDSPTLLPPSQTSGGSTGTSLLSLPIDLTNVFEANLRNVMAASGASEANIRNAMVASGAADLAKLNAAVKAAGAGRNGLSITRTSSNDILQQGVTEISSATSTSKIESAPADSSEPGAARHMKEQFRLGMAGVIVHYLNPYRKEDCTRGRIMNNDDFKHLARKLTHFVLVKELKHCRSVGDLQCNENVKHKAKDFIRKYMSKFGEDLLAAHNGTWGTVASERDSPKRHGRDETLGQEKIVRAFSEIMKNMGRMKTCVRPSMCKPYGKQSESLQKSKF
ncbi:uncharacterized protein LOC103516727 [Diaphorina citri]|uniref:Uncharacterized protein LOC103516727 n=1 Tax=Diaphorina citri TaxID=121845 RepID=A0A1S4EKI0_DIACI|nr:uncharacterized protein LOC103516727 [Diaphorina citri]